MGKLCLHISFVLWFLDVQHKWMVWSYFLPVVMGVSFLDPTRKSVTLSGVPIIQSQAVLERELDSVIHNWNSVLWLLTLPLTHEWPWIGSFSLLIYTRAGVAGMNSKSLPALSFYDSSKCVTRSHENIQLSWKITVILLYMVLNSPTISLLLIQYVYLWNSTRFLLTIS